MSHEVKKISLMLMKLKVGVSVAGDLQRRQDVDCSAGRERQQQGKSCSPAGLQVPQPWEMALQGRKAKVNQWKNCVALNLGLTVLPLSKSP